MEKRFTLALVLSLVVLFVWQAFFLPKPKPKPKPEETSKESTPTPPPSPTPERPEPTAPGTGVPPPIRPDEIRRVELSNDLLRLTLSSHGAVIEKAELLDYWPTVHENGDDAGHLQLLTPSTELLHGLRLDDLSFPGAHLGETLWEMRQEGSTVIFEKDVVRAEGDATLTYHLRKEITLPPGRARHADVKLAVAFEGEPDGLSMPIELALLVTGGVFQEAGQSVMAGPRSILYKVEDELSTVTSEEAVKSQEKSGQGALATLRGQGQGGGVRKALSGSIRFAADLSTYFGAFFVLESFPEKVTAVVHALPGSAATPEGEGVLVEASERIPRTCTILTFRDVLERGKAEIVHEGLLYLGPLDREYVDADLGGSSPDIAEAVSQVSEEQLGAFAIVAKAVLWMLGVLHGFVGNWGWAIVLLTIVVRVLLFPINRRSQGAMMKHQEAMARIKPKLDQLKKKHENDPRKFAEEQMKLMKAERVPIVPLGGCLPILLQIPIFFGLFSGLRATIDLRQATWLWVPDLSQPDHLLTFDKPIPNPLALCGGCCGAGSPAPITGLHLLPILMTIAWVLNSYFMPRPATSDPQMEQQRKMMMFMPLLFGFMMYTYAAALSLYWLTSSMFGIVETRIIKKLWPVKTAGPAKDGG